MKSLKLYRDKEKMLNYKKRCRKKNYSLGKQNEENTGKPYTTKERKMILLHEKTDRELAQILGRSVQAIQIFRCRTKGYML